MMDRQERGDEVIDIPHPEFFYKDAIEHLIEAIFKLFENFGTVDLLTVIAN